MFGQTKDTSSSWCRLTYIYTRKHYAYCDKFMASLCIQISNYLFRRFIVVYADEERFYQKNGKLTYLKVKKNYLKWIILINSYCTYRYSGCIILIRNLRTKNYDNFINILSETLNIFVIQIYSDRKCK